ncbi:MAG: DUF222 domain-containing protein [Acidimicrobiaceae bacterium]|nr:DUF222 domain-containing protein [Acidimicrobiaceae bacterium]
MKLNVMSDRMVRRLEPVKLIALIAQVQGFIDKAVAYQCRLIAIAEQQRSARATGDISVADSLVRNTGMSRSQARRAQWQAKTIAEQPDVADVLASGAINTDQAEMIARAKVSKQTRKQLLETAVGEGADATRTRTAVAELAERDETPEQRFMRQHAARFLRFFNNREGMVCLEGALDPDSGARLKAKVAAVAQRMWRKDKKQPPSQRRTPQQRDIDALCAATSQPRTSNRQPQNRQAEQSQQPKYNRRTEQARRSEQNRQPQHQNRRTEENQQPKHDRQPGHNRQSKNPSRQPRDNHHRTASEDMSSGSGCNEGHNSITDGLWEDFNNNGRRVAPVLRVSTSLKELRNGLFQAGITDSGEHLSAETLRRLACDAEIIPTVLNGKGRVIDVGRRTRKVSEALRCVITERDRGCVWSGCDAPPSRCDAHHVEHWADGGLTNADNLALLCHPHHILLHEGGYRLKRRNSIWVTLKPDETPLHTPIPTINTRVHADHTAAHNGNTGSKSHAGVASDVNSGWGIPEHTQVSTQTHLTLACHNHTTIYLRANNKSISAAEDAAGHTNHTTQHDNHTPTSGTRYDISSNHSSNSLAKPLTNEHPLITDRISCNRRHPAYPSTTKARLLRTSHDRSHPLRTGSVVNVSRKTRERTLRRSWRVSRTGSVVNVSHKTRNASTRLIHNQPTQPENQSNPNSRPRSPPLTYEC